MDEEQQSPQTYNLADIRSKKSLWYRLHVYTYDLRNFKTDGAARERLDSIVDVTYLGEPYFNPEEVEIFRNTVCKTSGSETLAQKIESTLDERLNRRIKKRVESGDFRVCAAHDLAPIFESAFGINPKNLAKNHAFNSLVSSRGLTLQDEDDLSCLLGQSKLEALAAKQEKSKKRKGKSD